MPPAPSRVSPALSPTPRAAVPPALAVLLLAAAAALLPAPLHAQAYARFAVPESALADALRGSGGGFEASWNALVVSTLRARLAGADSAARLAALATRVAAAEPAALGSHVAVDAWALWRRATPVAQRQRVRAAVRESLGVAALGARDFVAAESLDVAALADYRALGDRRRAAWLMGSIGVVRFQSADYAGAERAYREALDARRALGDPRMIGATLNALGSTTFQQRRYAEAAAFFDEARRVREGTGERAALGQTLNFLGLALGALGKGDSARVCFARALELTVAQGDSARTQQVLINLAQRLVDDGEGAASLPLWTRALALTRQLGDPQNEAHVEFGMGAVLRQQGRYAEGAAHVSAAAALSAGARDARAEQEAWLELGRIWLEVQDADAARPPLERALALADSIGDANGRARALNDLGIAARLAGDATLAKARFEAAAAAAESLEAAGVAHDARVSLGELAMDRGAPAEAATWFGKARALDAPLGVEAEVGDAVNEGSAAALSGRLDDANARFEEALATATRAGAAGLTWTALLGLGDVAERRGDLGAALAYDRRAASLIDTLRAKQGAGGASITLLSRRYFAFEALIHLLGKADAARPESGYAAEAFAWAERARARALLDLLASRGRSAVAPSLVGPEQAARLLEPGREALLEYSIGDSSSTLWVVTRRGWKRFTLPPRAALATRVEILRRGLASPEGSESRRTRAAARALYVDLVAPALPALGGVRRLVIAPDGALARIPFEALLAADAPEGAPAPRGAYLAERYSIRYTPSASALTASSPDPSRAARRATPANASTRVVAIGDPRFGATPPAGRGTPLDSLPYTGDELRALAHAARGSIDVLSGDFATRSRFLALPQLSHARVVHVGTHGQTDERDPSRSGLWFAAEDGAPGFLSLDDVLALRLDAELVTLSACETGLGRVERGEGVVGLGRAFLAAGARSVVVSLWSVNDRSTATLMSAFYETLLAKGLPRDEALAGARRALLASPATRAPFYWAPFVLIGDGGRLPS